MTEPTVFSGGFAVVTLFAKRLPILPVPKQRLVAFMRLNVVNNLRCFDYSLCFTHNAQRMLLQKGLRCFLPFVRVAALIRSLSSLRRFYGLRSLLLMLFAVTLTPRNRLSASRITAKSHYRHSSFITAGIAALMNSQEIETPARNAFSLIRVHTFVSRRASKRS